jgi:hypothetical protein
MQITREETYRLLWNQMQNSKFKEFYIDLLLEKYQKRERTINIFLLLVTSSSISAWAIWQRPYLAWLWAAIIALSQIISLIKPYLNYAKYAKELNEKHFLIQTLNVEYEKLWVSFKFEKISTESAFEKAFELKNTLTKGMNFSDDIIISENKEIQAKAKEKVAIYLKTNFNHKTP